MVLNKSKINKQKIKYKISKKNKILLQYAGEDTEQLLKKIRAYSGELVLVIGSNYSEPWCLEFAKSAENIDKMVITLDLSMAEQTQINNFKLDFNKIETWHILHEFDERFRTIIFDIGTNKWLHAKIDYIMHIKQMLIIGGKMYSFLPFIIPSNIPTQQYIRELTDIDIDFIKYKYHNIPIESIEKIGAITEIMFSKTPFGMIRGKNPDYPSNYFIFGVDTKGPDNKWIINKEWRKDKYDEDNLDWLKDWRLERDVLGNNLNDYMNSLFLHYELMTNLRILNEAYGFKTVSFEHCNEYPLKHPYNLTPNAHMNNICFTVCTK
jgi:hypothetical protein